MNPVARCLVVWCVAALALVSTAGAQGTRATVAGTVKDSRGLALPRITVTIRNLESDAERPAVTAPDGTFSVGGLAPGRYRVSISEGGIADFQREISVAAGERAALDIVLSYTVPDFVPVRSRWLIGEPLWVRYENQDAEYPFAPNRGFFGPYEATLFKGDFPINEGDDLFMVLGATAETPFDYTGSEALLRPSAILSFELFRGDTAFKPKDWAFRITPHFNVNYVSSDVGARVALQEAFAERKLVEVGPNFDFISMRGGIQPFNSDFRGFLFRDSNLGVRAFGNWGQNRNQWNVAFFDQLAKDSDSELNTWGRRNQGVFIANYYRQDFLTEGYAISPSVHINRDGGVSGTRQIRAYYAGIGGDGHWGRLNVTHQVYQVFGSDDGNPIAARPVDVNAHFAAAEFSIDLDWYRPRIGVVYASGDADPADDRGTGFDAILDNPNIAGGPFSFWVRQGLRVGGDGPALDGRNSVLPALRTNKLEGQANFVNPGLLLINGGVDADLTTKLRLITNVNVLRFRHTESLQRVLRRDDVDAAIGVDLGAGAQYRPALNDHVVITGGLSALVPARGFKQVFTGKVMYSPFLTVTVAY